MFFKEKKIMKYKKLLPIVKYDDYIKEWDYEKNKDHNPNTLTAGSASSLLHAVSTVRQQRATLRNPQISLFVFISFLV